MNMLLLKAAAFCALLCGVCPFSCGGEAPKQEAVAATGPGRDVLDFYRTHSPWTQPGEHAAMYEGIAGDIGSIVESVQGVLMHGGLVWLYELKPSEAQDNGFQVRKVQDILQRVRSLDNAPLTQRRPNQKRLLVNCRQFAVLTCSVLRHKGIPARVRAGYALYTWGRGKYENHWICEYWKEDQRRWVMVDAQIDSEQRKLMRIDFDTLNVPVDKFIVAWEGWRRYRAGKVGADAFGLGGRDGWNALGWEMVMPNVTCDLMALNKTELLPWDVNPYWKKKEADMAADDVALIETAASLSRQVDGKWAQMREFYKGHPVFCAPDGILSKEQDLTAEDIAPAQTGNAPVADDH